MTVINTNVGALNARTYAINASKKIDDNMKKLSSGLRVTSGSDDAAGLAVANKLESQLRSTNMSIQNAANGISLIQTAGSGMNKVNSMLIRIREVSVQMANGVYTDQDRQNAQAEVTLLLEEINKISENLQFNQVALLDGSYEQSFRTGASNEEVFGLSIISQRAEELGKESGLKAFGTVINASSHYENFEKIKISGEEATSIKINTDQMGDGFKAFLNTNPNSTFSLSGDDAAIFSVSQSGEIQATNLTFDTTYPENNTYSFSVNASSGSQKFTNEVTFELQKNSSVARVKSSSTSISSSESANLSFRSVNSSNATDGVLSLALQNFVDSDAGVGVFSISGGNDASHFSVDATSGVVTSNIEFEDFGDLNSDNTYNLELKYTSSTGDEFLEIIDLSITNAQEEVVEYVLPPGPIVLGAPSRFSLQIDNKTINSAPIPAGPLSFSDISDRLNTANQTLSPPARATFRASGAGIEAVFDNAAGDVPAALTAANLLIEQRMNTSANFISTQAGPPAASLATDATAYSKTYTELNGAVNIAKAGDIFTFDYDGTTISATVPSGQSAGDFSIADLANELNVANNNLGSPQPINFSVNGDDLVVTRTILGTTTPPPSFGSITFNGTALSSSGTNVVAQDSNDRSVVLDISGFAYNFGGGDIPEITIDGETITAGTLAGINPDAELAASLTTALNSKGISVTWDGASNLIFTTSGLPATTANAINFGQLNVWLPGFPASVAINRTDAEASVTFSGANNVSAGGRDNSASGNNTDSQATNALSGTSASQTSQSLEGAHSVINFKDDFTISLKTENLSKNLSNFLITNPFGDFKLAGADSSHFKIDAFDGTIKTTPSFKSEPKSTYSISVIYAGKNGQTFKNDITLNRDITQDAAKDSVADVDISTSMGANEAITILDRAINQMAAQEATMGAAQNRLEYAIDYLSMASLNTAASKGRVIDADFAKVSSELAKSQILNQASTSVLAQANSSKQMYMALLN